MGHTSRGNVSCDSSTTKTLEVTERSSLPSNANFAANNISGDVSDLVLDESLQIESSEELSSRQQLNSNCGKKTNSGSGLEWFDTIQKRRQGLNISPISKMTEDTTIKAQTEVFPGLKAATMEFNKNAINVKAVKQPKESSSCRTRENNLPDEVVIEHVSKKWHKLNKKLMKGTTDGLELSGNGDPSEEVDSLSTGPLHSTPARGRKRPRVQVDPGKGTEGVQDSELQVKLAQLAKFSFKQKTKLLHSPESENELTAASGDDRLGNVGTESMQKAAPAEKLRRLLEGSASLDNGRSVRQEKSLCTASTAGSLEKEAPVVSHVPSSSVLANEENKQNEALHNRKISSTTLSKLAKFSFTSSEDKIVDTPGITPESENPSSSRKQGGGGKRKCFQLEPLPNNALGTKSLFSTSDFDDETLDLDWNIETKGKN